MVSQRALQVHTDPLLGYTELDGVGYVVSEVSPYEFDLDWGEINEPDEMASVVRPARPGHREGPLRLRRGQRPGPRRLPDRGGDRRGRRGPPQGVRRRPHRLRASTTPSRCAQDHALFVDAFREGRIGGVSAT